MTRVSPVGSNARTTLVIGKRHTLGCFLSPKLCKVLIMIAKGKAQKVLTRIRKNSKPIIDFPEGILVVRLALLDPYGLAAWKDRHLILERVFFVSVFVVCIDAGID